MFVTMQDYTSHFIDVNTVGKKKLNWEIFIINNNEK